MVAFGKLVGSTIVGIGGLGFLSDHVNIPFVSKPVDALKRYGLTLYVASRIVLDYRKLPLEPSEDEMSKCHSSSAKELLKLCQKNGGIFIKVGQHIGALEYLLPEEYVETMKVLHSSAPQSTPKSIRSTLNDNLGANWSVEELGDFSDEPIASASLAQVHTATLLNSRNQDTVAVKVQHPLVARKSETDMWFMKLIAKQAQGFLPQFKFKWIIDEIEDNLPKELDFNLEAKNSNVIRNILSCRDATDSESCFDWLIIPRIVPTASNERVLTMEYTPGIHVNDKDKLEAERIDKNLLLNRIYELYAEMIFNHGTIHCDPHPGNMLVSPKSKDFDLILLDHGLYQNLDDKLRLIYAKFWLALTSVDEPKLKKCCLDMGLSESDMPLVSSVVTARSWDVIKHQNLGIASKSIDKDENERIKDQARTRFSDLTNLLSRVPRPLLLIFKCQDHLRGLETRLGERADPRRLQITCNVCIKALKNDDLARLSDQKLNPFSRWFNYFRISFSWWLVSLKFKAIFFIAPYLAQVPTKWSSSNGAIS